MLALKYLLLFLGVGLFSGAGILVIYDVYVAEQLRRLIKRQANAEPGTALAELPRPFAPVRWGLAQRSGSRRSVAAAAGAKHRGDSRRIRRSAHQPDLGRASRHAVSGRAHRHAADRQRVAL